MACKRGAPGRAPVKDRRAWIPHRILPPCQVCGVKATGFHYGAYTCEACKAFFRRLVKKTEVKFECTCSAEKRVEDGSQIWTNECPLCRYKRCIALGMSRDGIRIGRYTSEQKNQNIVTVKNIELAANQKEGMASSKDAKQTVFKDGIVSADAYCDDNQYPKTVKETYDLSECEMESIITSMIEAQKTLQSNMCTRDLEEVRQKQQECYNEYKSQSEVFGSMQLSKEEYLEFYRATGIDIDDRQLVMKEYLRFVEQKAAKVIRFAKTLPGFTDLPIDDQAALIKASRAEFLVFDSFRTVNQDLKVFTTPWGRHLHIDQLEKLVKRKYVDIRLDLVKKLQAIDLNSEETVILRGIGLSSTDRFELELKCRDKVETMQMKLVNCLRYIVNKQGLGKNRLAKLLSILPALRDVSHMDREILENLNVEVEESRDQLLLQELIGL